MVLLAIPGSTILTVISCSASQGRRAAWPSVVGVALGDATALLLSQAGLGALLATSALWFNAVKGAGGQYLLYLGIRLLRAGASAQVLPAAAVPESLWRLFLSTCAVTALNNIWALLARRPPQ